VSKGGAPSGRLLAVVRQQIDAVEREGRAIASRHDRLGDPDRRSVA
jgi:hypothetical protein